MKLQVAFSRPKKFAIGSSAIRLFTNSSYSHALLRWRSESLDKDMVYQASHGMVHFISGERFDESNDTLVAYEFDLTNDQYRQVVRKCVELAGVKYGYLELWGMAVERLTGLKSPFRDGHKSFVCSELVGEVLRQTGVANIDIDLELAGPKELEQAIIMNGGKYLHK
jgi:hypothetical protein